MVQYRLHYFDLAARGEPIRMLFHFAGQPFEDVRIKGQDWMAQKQKFTYGQVPVLEVDGKQLAQSYTILQYLGKKFGLAGKDEWEEAKAAEMSDYLKDTMNEFLPYLGAKAGFRRGDVAKLREEVFLPGAKKYFPMMEKLLAQSGSGFLLPSGVSYVDFGAVSFIEWLNAVEPEVVGQQKGLIAYIDRVNGLPQLRDYMNSKRKAGSI